MVERNLAMVAGGAPSLDGSGDTTAVGINAMRAGIAQLVERNLAKVAGGAPSLDGSGDTTAVGINAMRAGIAQLVERNLAKVEVAGSNPVSRSIILKEPPFLIIEPTTRANQATSTFPAHFGSSFTERLLTQ